MTTAPATRLPQRPGGGELSQSCASELTISRKNRAIAPEADSRCGPCLGGREAKPPVKPETRHPLAGFGMHLWEPALFFRPPR